MEIIRKFFKNSLLRNAFFFLQSTAFSSLFGFLFWFVVAKQFEQDQVGITVSLISAIGLIATLSQLGLGMGYIRFAPEKTTKEQRKIFFTSSGLISIVAVIGSILFFFLFPTEIKGNETILALIFVACTVTLALSMYTDQVIVGKRIAHHLFIKTGIVLGGGRVAIVLALPLLFIVSDYNIILSWGIGIFLALTYASLLFLQEKRKKNKDLLKNTSSSSVGDTKIKEILGFSMWNYLDRTLGLATGFLLPIIVVFRATPEMAASFYIDTLFHLLIDLFL